MNKAAEKIDPNERAPYYSVSENYSYAQIYNLFLSVAHETACRICPKRKRSKCGII